MANEKRRLIDAKSLEKQIKQAFEDINPYVMGQMLRWVRKQHKVDAVEVVHGRWEEYQVPPIMCCSECDWGTGIQSGFNYCPNCGAKMDGDRNG